MRTPRPDHMCRPCVPLIIPYGGKSTSCKSCIMCLGKHRVHWARLPHSVHMRRGRDERFDTSQGLHGDGRVDARGRDRAWCSGPATTGGYRSGKDAPSIFSARSSASGHCRVSVQRDPTKLARERGGGGKVGVRGIVSGGESKRVQRRTREGG